MTIALVLEAVAAWAGSGSQAALPLFGRRIAQSWSPVTLGTYAHVIRELKGEPAVLAEEQVERARQELPGRFRDVGAAEANG